MSGVSAPTSSPWNRPRRVGVFGNVNNFPFMIVRALRARGHDVRTFVDGSARLHRPEFRYADITVPYPEWLVDASPFQVQHAVLPSARRAAILASLATCDAVILNGYGIALGPLLTRPAFVVCTGSDLEYHSNPATLPLVMAQRDRSPVFVWREVRRYLHSRLIARQRATLANAACVSYHAPGISPVGDALLDGLGVTGSRRVWFQPVPLDVLELAPPPVHARVRVFCVARHTWVKPLRPGFTSLDYKGSDVMIRGLAKYIAESGTALDIRFVEKGLDVEASKALIASSGLAAHVTWLPELTQAEVWDEYRRADIVFDQLDASAMSMGALEAMAVGRPVIANGRPEIMRSVLGAASPHCQATTDAEVAAHLARLVPDAALRARIGAEGRIHIEREHHPDGAASKVLAALAPHVSA